MNLPSGIIDRLPASGVDLSSHADYIADTTHVSNSMLATFRKSPALYHGRYISRTIPPKEDTDATLLGTLLHLSQSEPDTWRDRFVISPETAPDGKKWLRRKGSDHERWWQEFEARCEAEGKWNIPAEERDKILGMAAALVADPIAAGLLSAPSWREQTIFWNHESGLPCKCRPDVSLTTAHCLVDLKSSRDPSPEGFNRAVGDYGYHHQAEHYRSGYMAHHGVDDCDFLFIAVGNEPPHDVFVHRLDIDWQAIGHEENQRDLRRLADCYAFDQWHPVGRGTIHELTPPTWRIKQWENA